MSTTITLKKEPITIKKGKLLMNCLNESPGSGKPETEDLNYYFKIWLKKGRDNSNR